MSPLTQNFFWACTVCAATLAPDFALSQQADLAPEDSFSLEAAILDTSIPFALGAHEARQELRGAFGWPTFQEGLVEGVYFRFDPDGYARFSPTPRLDSDVFEVICRPRTHVCMGRKGTMSLTLNQKNMIEIQLENVTETDGFSVAEGITIIPLPATILQPLESKMELLLSSGGDLVISRAQKEVDRVSLKGFAAVAAYLRWVAAQQSYAVLPPNWPIPNASAPVPPKPEPQTASWGTANRRPETPAQEPRLASDVSDVQLELQALRSMLLGSQDPISHTQTNPTASDHSEYLELHRAVTALAAEITVLQQRLAHPSSAEEPARPPSNAGAELMPSAPETMTEKSDAQVMAERLEYLMSEIGLAPETALMLLQAEDANDQDAPSPPTSIDDLLSELRSEIPAVDQETNAIAAQAAPHAVSEEEYQLLTDYFRSVYPIQ